MAVSAEITISGLSELRKKYNIIVLERILMDALVYAMAPVPSLMSASAPIGRTGRLRRMSLRRARRGIAVRIVSAANYAHLVDRGHRIVVGGKITRAKRLAGKYRAFQSGRFTGRTVGFVPGRNFALPTLLSAQGEIERRLDQYVQAALAR